MAQLTRLSDGEVRQIVAPFGLALESWQALPALGTVNSNYRVRASGRDWFLRVNEGKGEADVAAEAALVLKLAAHGVPTPQPLTADGRAYVAWGEKFVTLFPWVAGLPRRIDGSSNDGQREIAVATEMLDCPLLSGSLKPRTVL